MWINPLQLIQLSIINYQLSIDMKLLLDDKTTRGYNLNANEACIFAAILKCTRAGRGWYGNYRELAAAMPFVINRMTVSRAVQKLLNLGLIEERDNALIANEQSSMTNEQFVHEGAQFVHNDAQNVQQNAQSVLPPNNLPIIINNMNEKEKEQQRALCARDCESQTPSFNDLIEIFSEKGGKPNEGATRAAIDAWSKCSIAKRIKLIEAVKSGAHFKPRLDWLISDFPEPEPDFLSGQEQDRLREQGIPLVQVKYNGKFLICTRETMTLFNLEFVRDW